MVIDPKFTAQQLLQQLSQQRQARVEVTSQVAATRSQQTLLAVVEEAASLTPRQRQLLMAEANPQLQAVLRSPHPQLLKLSIASSNQSGASQLAISESALPPGSKVTLQTTASGLFAIITNKAANNIATNTTPEAAIDARLQQKAIDLLSASLRDSLPRQTPLAQLLKGLDQFQQLPKAIQQTLIPQALRPALQQLQNLGFVADANRQQPGVSQAASPPPLATPITTDNLVTQLKQTIRNSGIFWEHKLAQQLSGVRSTNVSPHTANTPLSDQLSVPQPNLLIRNQGAENGLREVLQQLNRMSQTTATTPPQTIPTSSSPLSQGPSPSMAAPPTADEASTSQDIKGLLLHLKHNLETQLRQNTGSVDTSSRQAQGSLTQQLTTILQQFGGQALSDPNVARQARNRLTQALHQQVLSSLARVQLQQAQSLATRLTAAETSGQANLHLHLDLPIKWEGVNYSATMEIMEERVKEKTENEDETEDPANSRHQARQWHVILSFDLPDIGGFYSRIRAINDVIKVEFWADQNATLDKAREKLTALKHALTGQGVLVEDIQCREGAPPAKTNKLSFALVDITT